ncbi:hypothetical protein CPB84DRAFT_1792967 [Gymnopilus junonius]|uniref:Uncharacterized protein n=1 Tax=Gymnopilus junonius TaxID=109634 RepID=A0A9P5NF54_GYMJU|nr:hypothetical protein CPB84DRAFT_1792967 [Gymnopilus junonius]
MAPMLGNEGLERCAMLKNVASDEVFASSIPPAKIPRYYAQRRNPLPVLRSTWRHRAVTPFHPGLLIIYTTFKMFMSWLLDLTRKFSRASAHSNFRLTNLWDPVRIALTYRGLSSFG